MTTRVQANCHESRLNLRFVTGTTEWATGTLAFPSALVICDLRADRIRLRFADGTFWKLRWREADSGVILLESSTVTAPPWCLSFAGTTLHTHKQLSPVPATQVRLGLFSQHGQLFDFRDWALVEDGDRLNGLIALRTGSWTPHSLTMTGNTVAMPLGQVRRSYLLVHAPRSLLQLERLGIDYFEPAEGYAAGPARLLARHGFARAERLRSYTPPRTRHNAFGKTIDVPATQRDWMMQVLERLHRALCDGAYLHPLGNPVACREFGAACATFHWLELSEADRQRAGTWIAQTADLVMRRDFYPHHYATKPFGLETFRGMLNQNFNTDRYVMVGLAGCVLVDHPRATWWRRHAIEQFREQMAAFVWPGGVWEESHTYANHVKLCLLPLALALRHAPERFDMFADERFRAFCRSSLATLSPRDALLDGQRALPAIGDHGYSTSDGYLYGWLATLRPDERATYEWAWREMGARTEVPDRPQVNVFAPLLTPVTREARAPQLPALLAMPGFGAVARDGESLLVVRCGGAWGHYHPDQGSFWWWCRGKLVTADAELGSGPLKFRHLGHNVFGFPGHEPVQHLDRQPFRVTVCDPGRIGCEIPGLGARTFRWETLDCLTIIDEPVRSPGGIVNWTLHVVAPQVTRIEARRFEAGQLVLETPVEPQTVVIEPGTQTCRVTLSYWEQRLEHRLSYGRM